VRMEENIFKPRWNGYCPDLLKGT